MLPFFLGHRHYNIKDIFTHDWQWMFSTYQHYINKTNVSKILWNTAFVNGIQCILKVLITSWYIWRELVHHTLMFILGKNRHEGDIRLPTYSVWIIRLSTNLFFSRIKKYQSSFWIMAKRGSHILNKHIFSVELWNHYR